MKMLFACCLLLTGICLTSCDNEINLEAPYKEIGVIYGIIDPSDSIHFVRIQKAFLGKGNILEMAQIADSIYYPDILDVQLLRIKDGNILSSISLTRFDGPPKEDGVFPKTPNILYKTNGEVISRDSDYKIVVKNTQSGHVFSAQTPIVDSIKIIKPSIPSIALIQWASQFPQKVEYNTAVNGKIYNLTIRFKYQEEVIGSGIIVSKFVDWVFPNELVSNTSQIKTITLEIEGEDFYKFVGEAIKVDPNVIRYAGKLDFIFSGGAEFLANYVAINQATSSILTTIPAIF
ncbi:MAG: hypothetical protein IPP71_13930 [Bacteroidetes bacterium]|nr:hypothetical protein [Bacteroidota bacterium]